MRRVLHALILGLVLPAHAHAAVPDGTGRLLVTLKPAAAAGHAAARAAAVHAVASAAGARPSGFSVPQIRLVTVSPRPGESLHALAARLRADPRVASVVAERRAALRFQPNDPALVTPETAKDTVPGTTVEWWAARSGFPQAWDISQGAGATVAVIDTGAEIGHPELVGRVAGLASFDAARSPAGLDTIGHGTHVASLACAAGNNGVGLAGAGLGCQLLVIKSDFSDSSVAASIVWAVDHKADAINMSFGTAPGAAPSLPVLNAIDYAVANGVVLVSAAADDPIEDQGYPASILQPTGTGPDLNVGRGLSVTAADFLDRRAPFAGRGSQISLAAYGTYEGNDNDGPPGIFGAFTSGLNALDTGALGQTRPCRCRTVFGADARYAYLQGTSMAAPMVAAAAALVRHLNPDMPAAEIVRLLKQTARRPAGTGWTPELGWGILDAGAALARRRPAARRGVRVRAGRRRAVARARRPQAAQAAEHEEALDRGQAPARPPVPVLHHRGRQGGQSRARPGGRRRAVQRGAELAAPRDRARPFEAAPSPPAGAAARASATSSSSDAWIPSATSRMSSIAS